MNSIQWNTQSYIIDGQPGFLVSGEFHYFRVPKEDWGKRLELFIDTGGNCVATYVPWILHEPVENDIRFGDIAERDFEAFLRLCKEKGLFVICRPGPYQYSELRYDGLPGWLCENYPEIQAVNLKGERFRVSSISYMHPLFLQKVRKWFETVCPIIAGHTVAKGGPVAYVQFDNELMGMHEWFSGWDYHPVSMGIGIGDGHYTKFLMGRYAKNVQALNKAYGTDYKSFTEVRPLAQYAGSDMQERRRVKDYQDFYFYMCAEYAATLVGWIRELGIDCDIVHNSANPYMNAYFLEIVKRLGSNFILGSDHYYNLSMDWDQNNPTPKYATKCFYSNEMMRLMGFPATVFELPGGSCSEWPPITPEDLKCCYMTNIALGMKGSNYYVFTGGQNPLGLGNNGDSYDYCASVAADGKIRDTYYSLKEYGEFLMRNSWLAAADRECDFYIGLDWDHSRSKYYFAAEDRNEFCGANAWTFMRKGFMISALCASYSPNMVDLSADSVIALTDKPLFIATSISMRKDIQHNLVELIKKGGKILLAPVIPYLDENFNPCTIVMEFLSLSNNMQNRRYNEESARVAVGPINNVFMNGTVWKLDLAVTDAETVARDEVNGAVLGWEKVFPGGGKAIWLGISWKHSKLEHSRMIKYLLEQLDCVSQVVECSNPNLWTSLRSDGNKKMLFIMNLFSSQMEADIQVKKFDGSNYNTGHHKLAAMEVKPIRIE